MSVDFQECSIYSFSGCWSLYYIPSGAVSRYYLNSIITSLRLSSAKLSIRIGCHSVYICV